MNFQITKKTKPKQQKDVNDHLQFGLNQRKTSNKSIFQADDSSSSSEDETNNKRSGVNRSIRKEQTLVRNNVIMKNMQANDATLYDYDAEYESFASSSKNDKQAKEVKEKKSSRYISNLLKTAQQRQTEQDIIYERKVAKEQDIEDSKEEFLNKEKFITSAYKRALEERNVWEQQDKEKTEKEEEEDVRKKGSDSAFFGFYGNISKQKDSQHTDSFEKQDLTNRIDTINDNNGVNINTARKSYANPEHATNTKQTTQKYNSTDTLHEVEDKSKNAISRKEKIHAARIRYFERHPDLIPNEQ